MVFGVLIVFLLASGSIRPAIVLSLFKRPNIEASLIGASVPIHPQPGKQSYPRAIRLRSGTILASFTVDDIENAIQLAISRDGSSWSPYSTIMLKPALKATPIDNAFLLELPSGRILCAFRAHSKKPEAVNAEEKPGGQNEGYLFFRLMIYSSDDVGKSWKYLSTPTEEPGPVNGNWEPFLRLSNTGELQFFYSREIGGGRDQDNLMRVSRDEGLSWSGPSTVSGMDLETRDGMIGIQEVVPGSGHLMAVFETVEEKGDGTSFEARFELWSVTSRDDGTTWGERRMIYDSWHGHISTYP